MKYFWTHNYKSKNIIKNIKTYKHGFYSNPFDAKVNAVLIAHRPVARRQIIRDEPNI